jgi:hypothetical protein
VSDEELAHWWERWGPEQLAKSGVEEAAARAADVRHLRGQAALSEAIFGRFAALVAEHDMAARRTAGPATGR